MDDGYESLFEPHPVEPPMPPYPEAMGAFLRALHNPEPRPGPPFTHTFQPPPQEYDEDGEPIPMSLEPTHTVRFDSEPYDAARAGSSAFVAPRAGWYRATRRIGRQREVRGDD